MRITPTSRGHWGGAHKVMCQVPKVVVEYTYPHVLVMIF